MSAKKQPRNGDPASKTVAPPSPPEILYPSPALEKILGKVYDAYQKLDNTQVNDACRRDFIFHMTDWLDDLQRLYQFYGEPSRMKPEEAEEAVFGFLIHAVPHLMAAGHLL